MFFRNSKKKTSYERPSWDEYFLNLASSVSLRGDCRRSQVGSVLVNAKHQVLSVGYNGVSPGQPGCLSGACPRGMLSYKELAAGGSYANCVAYHAEANCLKNTRNVNLYKSDYPLTMYVTRRPCNDCWNLLLEWDVTRFVWGPPEKGRWMSWEDF